jgi:hypothetical protein
MAVRRRNFIGDSPVRLARPVKPDASKRSHVELLRRGTGSPDPGWTGSTQATFAMMKGLQSLGIEFLDLDGGGVADDAGSRSLPNN